jgi:hypothetical protein
MKAASAQQSPHTDELWKLRRLAEAQATVRELQEKLEDANTAMRKFRSDHCVVLGTQMYFRCQSIDGRAALDKEWHTLVTQRDTFLRQWNAALAEFAAAKTEN